MDTSLERIHDFIDELVDQYQREEEQAILQRNMDKAVLALAGKEACQRLRNYIGTRAEMDATAARVVSLRKKA